MLGADVETGGVFDPLGLAKDESTLYRSRLIELKHGRVAMLACLGTLVQSKCLLLVVGQCLESTDRQRSTISSPHRLSSPHA